MSVLAAPLPRKRINSLLFWPLLISITGAPSYADGPCGGLYRTISAVWRSESPTSEAVRTVLFNSPMLLGFYYPIYLPTLRYATEERPRLRRGWDAVRLVHRIGLGAITIPIIWQAHQAFQEQLEDDKDEFIESVEDAAASVGSEDQFVQEVSAEIDALSEGEAPEVRAGARRLLQETLDEVKP